MTSRSLASSAYQSATDKLNQVFRKLTYLEHQAGLVMDSNDIKRLQRAYGYYVDNQDWENVVGLFTDDVSVEYGQDGLYQGKEGIKAMMLDFSVGIREGQLNEHLMVQPVITVSPDGTSAWGRWRNFGLVGQYGGSATWEEGPYENEYRKENGVWKISRIHWYETYIVPYAKGWGQATASEGYELDPTLVPEPDQPPSESYERWPGVYLTPFHWQAEEVKAAKAVQASVPELPTGMTDKELTLRITRLDYQVRLLEDENEIENLQRIYGYYLDKAMWQEVADLFTEDGTLEIGNSGVFEGKQRILEYLRSLGPEFPQWGRLFDHMQLQPVIHVGPSGDTANGRWRMFSQTGEWQKDQHWETGVYENEYSREDDVWKIKKLHLFHRMSSPYEDGWAKIALPDIQTQSGLEPDRPQSAKYASYPAAFFAPHHYDNPVIDYDQNTRKVMPQPESTLDQEEMTEKLGDIERRIGLLHDADQIENLQAIFGYYLDKNQWDALARIFAEDGTMEIALRGVYRGRQSIRKNLNLYGEQGVHHGNLHNHMQMQPVIHVADDGMTAKMRSRVFSQLGSFGKYAAWMGGVYENTFVKVDDIWKIKTIHQMDTFFAGFEAGWAMGQQRHAPGITESYPPDEPPSVEFDLFPEVFLPPYHYIHPVTGKPVTIPEVE